MCKVVSRGSPRLITSDVLAQKARITAVKKLFQEAMKVAPTT